MNFRAIGTVALIAPLALGLAPVAYATMSAMGAMTQGRGMAQGVGGENTQLWSQARRTLTASTHEGRVHEHTVSFRGRAVTLRIVANAPHHPDMSFEAGGLTNPTISVAQGSQITLILLNMDYGPGMAHGIVVTTKAPPYPPFPNIPQAQTIARIPSLAPRSRKELSKARYAEASVRFRAERPGTYYYVCPTPGHAQGSHMYGRFIVRSDR